MRALTRREVMWLALPIMLANAASMIVGVVDTTLIGRTGTDTALAGIGLGATIYGIFYWGFGFLRMSTAGLAAQAKGAGNWFNVQSHLARAVPLGLLIGTTLLILQYPLIQTLLAIYQAPGEDEMKAASYLSTRLWGVPAALASIALMGWFIGIGRTRHALYMQLVLNGLNAALSALLVLKFDAGITGVAAASAIAEWAGFVTGLILALNVLKSHGGLELSVFTRSNILQSASLKALGAMNTNIFIRTLTLTLGFQFFMWATSREGTEFTAANHILLQMITLMALVLDAFAHVAESEVGQAYGARSQSKFDHAVKITSQMAVLWAFILALVTWAGGPYLIDFMTTLPDIRETARQYLPWVVAVPILGIAAWQLDGIFIGATRTAAMRNAGILSVAAYLAIHFAITPVMGLHGIWLAFVIYYIARAAALLIYYSGLRRSLDGELSPPLRPQT